MKAKKMLALVLALTLVFSSLAGTSIPVSAGSATNYQEVIAQINSLVPANTASSTKTDIDAAWAAYNALTDAAKLSVTNFSVLNGAYGTYYNSVANVNGGKFTYIDFENGTASDVAGRITAKIGSSVSVVNEGKFGTKSVSTTNTNSLNSMVSWESDNYDPFLYTKDSGTSISMWVNISAMKNQNYIFNYGFYGHRFYVGYDNNTLKVSTRNNDADPTSELIIPDSSELLNNWTFLTITCDANKKWSVYFNDKLKASGTLVYSPYDLAERRATKQNRSKADWTSNYCLGASHYWPGYNNISAKYDDLAIYNSALTADQVKLLYNHLGVQGVIDLIAELPTVISLQDAVAISAARSAYNLLDAQEKEGVTNINKLVAAEVKYVEAMINALGTITADKADQIIAARDAFDKLSTEQQDMVNNLATLTAAEEAIALFGDITDVISKINAIGTVTYKSKSLIAAARTAYDLLSIENQSAIVTYFNKLTAAETALQGIYDAFNVSVTGWASASSVPWTANVTAAEKDETLAAFADELKFQYVVNAYKLGKTTGTYALGNWMNILNIQMDDKPNDNAGNPFGHADRYWAWATAPFAGMAFSEAGYFAKEVTYNRALSDSYVYNGKTYQQFWDGYKYHDYKESVNDGSTTITRISSYPGISSTGDVTNNTFRYAYANYNQTNKWAGYNLGIPDGNVTQKAAYTYQTFTGPQGKSYIVASANAIASANPNASTVEGAYVIARNMATEFIKLGADDASRFAFTGLPVSNEYDDSKGNLRQDFEEISILINKTTGEVKYLNTAAKVLDVTAPEIARTVIDNEQIYVLIKSGSTFSTSSITVKLRSGSTYVINAVSGEPNKYEIVVTAEGGDTLTHTLFVINENDVPESDKTAVANFESQLKSLPIFIYRNDLNVAKAVLSAYDNLTFIQKLLVKNEDELVAIKERVAEIQDNPIKVTCIGSSTSFGSGATNEAADSYPAQMERMFGGTISVTNASVPGTTVVSTAASGVGIYSYMGTSEYPRGLASDPDVVFMFVGSNDCEGGRWNSAGYKDQFIRDYTTILKAYQALESNPYVILCYPYQSYSGDRATYIPQVIDIIDDLAAEYNCATIDMYTPTKAILDASDWRTYFNDDKLHPTTAGYTKIAEVAKTYLSNYFDQLDDFDVKDVKLDGIPMAGFDATKDTYTIPYSDTLPVVTADVDGDCTVKTVQPTAENPIGYVCIESKVGQFGKVYQIKFVTESEGVVEYQIALADTALGKLTITNDTTAENIMSAVKGALTNNGVTVTWSKAAEIVKATEQAAGSIKGTLTFAFEEETADMEINLTIPRLASMLGDVNFDGQITVTDIVKLRDIIFKRNATAAQLLAGDLNDDGDLTEADVALLLDRLGIIPGDVSDDKKVTALDIMIIRKVMMEGPATDVQLAAGDLDGDGALKPVDIMKLRKMLMEQA